jgi:tripartite-type tricarboxylate transporter receptor subunit TctC
MRVAALQLIGLLFAGTAIAQGYPERPLRLIVPFPPGGNIDITARAIAPGLGEALGQQVIVDNRGGAGGTIGADLVAKSPPDGYLLVLGSTGTITVAPTLYPKIPYHPVRDFTPVVMVSVVPLVLVTHPSVPARTVKELIALARARGSKLAMASAGAGTTNHLAGELFQIETGVKFIHVPYKGSGPALVELMGGQVDLLFDQLSSASGYIKGGRLTPLAVTTRTRAALFPQVPTLAEAGVSGYEASTFTGIMGPAQLAREVVAKLNTATNRLLSQNATRERFASFGAEPLGGTAEHFAGFVREDYEKWTKVVKAANIRLE